LAIRAEQVFDALPESCVAYTKPLDKRGPLGWIRDFDGGKENAFGIFGRVRHHMALLQEPVRNPVFAEIDITKIL